MWLWLNEYRLVEMLDQCDNSDVRELVLAALDSILERPYGPDGVEVDVMVGPAGRAMPENRIAFLPGGWTLTYRVYVNGPPPHDGKHVVVVAATHLDRLKPES